MLIVNTDERPLLARGHRHRDGRHDSGSDIDIPVVVVPQSAAAPLSAGGAEVTLHLEFDVMASSPVPVDEYGTLVQRSALEHEKVPSVPRTVAPQPAPEPAAPEPEEPAPESDPEPAPRLTEGDVLRMTVRELKVHLEERDLETKGLKAALQKRLLASLAE